MVKTGETTSCISQEHKDDYYEDVSNVKAFKIYIRVVFENDRKEIDIVFDELAKNDKDMKIISDEKKLSWETKDTVDSMISTLKKIVQTFEV